MNDHMDYYCEDDVDGSSLMMASVSSLGDSPLEIYTSTMPDADDALAESREARYNRNEESYLLDTNDRSAISCFEQDNDKSLDASSLSQVRNCSDVAYCRDSFAHHEAGLEEDWKNEREDETHRTDSTSGSSASLESQSSPEDGSYLISNVKDIFQVENGIADHLKHDSAEKNKDLDIELYLDDLDHSTTALSHPAEPSYINVTRETSAVCFGWINHPLTKRWRNAVHKFSNNVKDYPYWSDEIAYHVMERLKQEGIRHFFVTVNKRIFNDEKQSVGGWRPATKEEIFFKTKQRFQDDRKLRNLREKQPVQSFCKPSEFEVARRSAVFAFQAVCFEWNHHPGTVKWLETVQVFAEDTSRYPEWDDRITNQVKAKLVENHITSFLVFLNSNGKPCVTISDGMWCMATDDEIREKTRRQFYLLRSRFKQEPSSRDQDWFSGTPKSAPVDIYSTGQWETYFASEQDRKPSVDGQSILSNSCSDFAGVDQDKASYVFVNHPSPYFTDEENSSLSEFLTDPELFCTEGEGSSGDDTNDWSAVSSSHADEVELHATSSFPASKRKKFNDDSFLLLPEMATASIDLLRFSNCASELVAAVTPNKMDVCFGWIKHRGTKIWRDAVKMFSDNRTKFPVWSDDMVDHVKQILKNAGIARYLVCRKSAGNSVRKIFDDRRELHGMWEEATEQEITDRTKQRFLNDRKRSPEPLLSCKKRPRGRPPKKQPIFDSSVPGLPVEVSCNLAQCHSGIDSDLKGCERSSCGI